MLVNRLRIEYQVIFLVILYAYDFQSMTESSKSQILSKNKHHTKKSHFIWVFTICLSTHLRVSCIYKIYILGSQKNHLIKSDFLRT